MSSAIAESVIEGCIINLEGFLLPYESAWMAAPSCPILLD